MATKIRYGCDLNGVKIKAKEGTTILKEGEEIPEKYIAWLNGYGWLGIRHRHYHSMENGVAQVFGNFWCYAKINEKVVDNIPKVVVESSNVEEAADMSCGLQFD